jgi:hypothetical protein
MRVLTEASGQSRRWYLTSQPKQEGTKPKKAAWGYARRKWCSESGCEVDQGHSKKGLALGLRIDRRDPIRRVAYCGSRILRICVSIAMNSLAFRISLLPRCFDFQFTGVQDVSTAEPSRCQMLLMIMFDIDCWTSFLTRSIH